MEKTKDEEVVNLQELALARKRNRSRFTDEEKQAIVEASLVRKVPIQLLSRKHGVSRMAIYRWISNFASGKTSMIKTDSVQNITNSTPMSKKVEKPAETPEQELKRLREENKRLEEALKTAEWMNHAKDVMIDVAEETFNIQIRKKSGAKQ